MTTNPNDYVYSNAGIGQPGLTKREYFAAMAMQGLLSIYDTNINAIIPNDENICYMTTLSVKAADELIKALNENQKA